MNFLSGLLPISIDQRDQEPDWITLSLNSINTRTYFFIWRWEREAFCLLTVGITKYFPGTFSYLGVLFFWVPKNSVGDWASVRLTCSDSAEIVMRFFQKAKGGITKGCKVAGTWDKGRTGEGGLCCLVPSGSQQFKTQLQRSPLGILQRTFSLLSTGLFTPFSPSFPLVFCFPVLSKTNFVFWSSVFRSLYCEEHFTLFTYLFGCAGS